MKDPKNWLTLSVFLNAILGGLLVALLFESERLGVTFLFVFLFVVVIIITIVNKRTVEEEEEYRKSLAPSTSKTDVNN